MMHVIKIADDKIRVVHGKLVNELTLDWSKSLGELRELIEFSMGFEENLPSLKKAKYKNILVYEGGNHIDIVEDGVGSLDLLIIEDHHV